MRSARLAWFPALVLVSTLATLASAQEPATPGGVPPGSPPAGKLQQALGLTDDQTSAIRQIEAQRATDRKQLSTALRQAEADLRQLALGSGDPAALQAKQAEVAQLLGRSVAMHVESLQAMAAILTPEQRAKLAQMSSEGPWRHGPRHRAPRGS
jgi:Spy/CpxP family protein refolding chaperone